MTTTVELLDRVKTHCNIPSDYALAKELGVTQQTVSRYRVGKDYFSDSTAIKVAELLDQDPGVIAASAHAERAKTDRERDLWRGIIKKLGGLAACILLGFAAPPPSSAQAQTAQSLCIMLNGVRIPGCPGIPLNDDEWILVR